MQHHKERLVLKSLGLWRSGSAVLILYFRFWYETDISVWDISWYCNKSDIDSLCMIHTFITYFVVFSIRKAFCQTVYLTDLLSLYLHLFSFDKIDVFCSTIFIFFFIWFSQSAWYLLKSFIKILYCFLSRWEQEDGAFEVSRMFSRGDQLLGQQGMPVLCGAQRLGLSEGVAGQRQRPEAELQQPCQYHPEDGPQLHPGAEPLRGGRAGWVRCPTGAAAWGGLQLGRGQQGQAGWVWGKKKKILLVLLINDL